MTLPVPLKLLGSPGSPYTRKMLALLRYRRIPYQFIIGSHRSHSNLPQPKVALLPTFYLPNAAGEIEAQVDSTPLIRRFEQAFDGRNAVPEDAAIAFLDFLLEDFADEWLTKAMFHFRWNYPADIDKAAEILPRWSVAPLREQELAPLKSFIAERQIGRLGVVGSNTTTAPVIEDSYRRVIEALKQHLETHSFIFGARPSAADFAIYGQLTQLARFDPTPEAITLASAPRLYAWVDVVDDLSGLEPKAQDWASLEELSLSLRPLLCEAGRTYAPVMLANAHALQTGADEVSCMVDGRKWTQIPFPYQGRCLARVRQEYAALPKAARRGVDAMLSDTGCEALFDGL